MENKIPKARSVEQAQQDFELTCETLGIEPSFYPIYLDLLCDEILLTTSELRKRNAQDIVVDISFVAAFRSDLDEMNQYAAILDAKINSIKPIQSKLQR